MLPQLAGSVAPARHQTLLRVSPLFDAARPGHLGAVGEIVGGGIFECLSEGWSARHALPVGTKNSDTVHLTLGRGGVFTITTNHYAAKNIWAAGRTMPVDGQRQQYVPKTEGRSTRSLCSWASECLCLCPCALIVLVGPGRITVRAQSDRVRVLNSHQVRRWLKQQPDTLGADAVSDLSALIDDPALWRATDKGESAEARRQFAELHGEVRASRGRRRL
ncbi:hypothetical protein [Microterricola viridarii]|uniref:NERD domain-containing protein n=1 Tax=Microterricola viridarii TaxID=412690 RepID=A0A1H1Y4I8_9MICO|nr:hypothetical protein [Microterricola viridarii]SDT16347.1 hypothetical protein SAMN04489834_2975 [Microterricola viridarii]